MKTLAKYHVKNRSVIGEKTFKNTLIGPGKLPGLWMEARLELILFCFKPRGFLYLYANQLA